MPKVKNNDRNRLYRMALYIAKALRENPDAKIFEDPKDKFRIKLVDPDYKPTEEDDKYEIYVYKGGWNGKLVPLEKFFDSEARNALGRMTKSIKTKMSIDKMMDITLGNIKLNNDFCKKVDQYVTSYVHGDRELIEFYGGAYIGVNAITFKTSYVNYFFNKILKVDKTDIKANFPLAPAINPKFKVTGDVFNITLFYLARRVYKAKLSARAKDHCIRNLLMIFCYRTVSALHNQYFSKFLISKDLASNTYDSLSNQFIIKKLGSWQAYMDYRVDQILSKKYKERERLFRGGDDGLLAVIVKAQGGIRSAWQGYFAKYLEVKESGRVKTSTSLVTDMGDDLDITTFTNDIGAVVNRVMLNKITAKDKLINPSLISGVSTYMPNYKEKLLRKALLAMFDHTHSLGGKKTLDLVRTTVVYLLHRVSEDIPADKRTSPDKLLKFVRGVITSSKSKDPRLRNIKRDWMNFIQKVAKIRSHNKAVKTRVALILYIFALTLTK